jgi:PAS domain S-box-containing protein
MLTNRAGLELFGYTKEEVTELYLLQRAVNPTQSQDFQERTEREGYVRDYEMKMRKKNGPEIDCLLTFTAERDADGNALGYEGIVRDVTEHKRMERNLSLYISQVTRAQEEERKRIARELHDETVQSLSALSLDIQRLAKGRRRLPEETTRELDQIRQKVTSIADELSRLSHALRPNVLDHLGLIPALKLFTSDFSKKSEVITHLEVIGTERRLSPDIELGLFRIVQEATRNIRKHAEATQAVIAVRFNDGRVTMTITDNGKGFEIPDRLDDLTAAGRLGLIGMQERAQLLDGEFSIHSKSGAGTTIRVETK